MNLDFTALAHAFAPEAVLLLTALTLLAVDIAAMRGRSDASRLGLAAMLGIVGVVVAAIFAWGQRSGGPVFAGVLLLDTFAGTVRTALLVLTGLTLLLSLGSPSTRHPAEYVALVLFAAVGFLLMADAHQLLMAFLALELASLSLYVLTGFDKARPESAEAGLKYFLFGGISAAFLLFGFSLVYGLTGALDFNHISIELSHLANSPLVTVAMVMILVAFGYKVAAAPFHLWAPDAYQGAPAPSAALVASASKLAGLVLFTRMLWPAFGVAAGDATVFTGETGWMTAVVLLSVASMLLGNLAALAQSDVRRILAYSAIAHAGVLLLGVVATGEKGPGPLFYYAATYGVATAGSFGAMGILQQNGIGMKLTDLAGLHRRAPVVTLCLFVFILSLAGVPPLAGFFGKFSVFAGALQMGGVHGPLGWAVVLAILLSAVGLYYYLLILKHAIVTEPEEAELAPLKVSWAAQLGLILAAGTLIVTGLFPSLLFCLV